MQHQVEVAVVLETRNQVAREGVGRVDTKTVIIVSTKLENSPRAKMIDNKSDLVALGKDEGGVGVQIFGAGSHNAAILDSTVFRERE